MIIDGQGDIQPAVPEPEIVEDPQGLSGEYTELRMVPLALELGDHHQWQDDILLRETKNRPRIREEHRGVQDVGPSSDVITGWCGGLGGGYLPRRSGSGRIRFGAAA